MKIIENANLPQNDVVYVAVSCEAHKLVSAIKSMGIHVIEVQRSSSVLDGLSSHADMHFLHLGGPELYISQDQAINQTKLTALGFDVHVLKAPLCKDYPLDVPLNAAVIGDNVFLNQKTICKEINFTGKNIIDVKQGYSKCSICAVSSNAIITDDIGIHDSAIKVGFDSLLIEKGDIVLKGMNYGFIGGCCGLISKDTMLFNGDIKTHRNCDMIKGFLSNYGINPVSIGNYQLTDIGGILPLLEK